MKKIFACKYVRLESDLQNSLFLRIWETHATYSVVYI